MGKIIHYDFRKETRKQEMRDIQNFLNEHIIRTYKEKRHMTPEEREMVKKYQNKWYELQAEEARWEGKDRWEESY